MIERDPTSTAGCAAAFSQHPDTAVAVGEVVGAVLEGIDPHPGFAMLYVSGDASTHLSEVTGAVRALLAPEVLVASTTIGVFGGMQEMAAPSGIALIAAEVDGCLPLRFDSDDEVDIADGLPLGADSGSIAVLLGARDFRFGRFQSVLDRLAPGVDMVGGGPTARSGGHEPELFVGDQVYADGAVGVLIPPAAASVCGLGAVLWDEDGDEIPVVGPVEAADAAGLVLFSEDQVGLLDGPTLDFDYIFERMDGALVGMAGRSFIHKTTDQDGQRSGIIKPRATALIINRPR